MLSEQLIWIVCAGFYLSDLFRYCGPHRLIVVQYGSCWTPLIPFYQFLIRNRAFAFLNPLTPWSITISAVWLSTGHRAHSEIVRQRRLLRTLIGRLAVIRIGGCVVFGNLFIIGPATTEIMGIRTSLVLVVPLVIATWLVTCGILWRNRRRLDLSWGTLTWLLIECIICPGYFANIWRRLLLARATTVDAMQLCAPTLKATDALALLERLQAYFDDLQERVEISAEDRRVFSTYRSLLRAP